MRAYQYVLSLAGVAVSVLFAAPMARAEDYPPAPPAISVNTGTVAAGHDVVVTGSGYTAGENVDIDVTYSPTAIGVGPRAQGGIVQVAYVVPERVLPEAVVKTVVANSSGAFSTTVHLTQPGTATITATGQESSVTQSVTVTVTAALPIVGGLPVTGDSRRVLIGEVVAGVGAVLVGTMLVWLAVRRRGVRVRT
jgi:hypothetical protein